MGSVDYAVPAGSGVLPVLDHHVRSNVAPIDLISLRSLPFSMFLPALPSSPC